MLEAVIVTIWFELADGTLRQERLGTTTDCEGLATRLYEKYEKNSKRLVAVKCDTAESLRLKKEMFKGLYPYDD